MEIHHVAHAIIGVFVAVRIRARVEFLGDLVIHDDARRGRRRVDAEVYERRRP